MPGGGALALGFFWGALVARRPPSAFFSPLPGRESLFFACPRTRRSVCEQRSWPEGRRAWMPGVKKSNPKKGQPGGCALRADALRDRERVPGFSTGLLPWRKGVGIHADSPAGLFVPLTLAPYGSPIQSSALRAVFISASLRSRDKPRRNATRRSLLFALCSLLFALCFALFHECALRAQKSPYAVSERGRKGP
jgi:hypothetical protein